MKKGKSAKKQPPRLRLAPPQGIPSAIDLISYLIGSDRLLDLLLNNVSDLIVVLDRDGKRIYNSPSYRTVLGDPDSLRGTSAFGEIHPEDRSHIQKIFQQTVKTGKGQKASYRFLLPGGAIRNIESRGHIIRDAKGEIRYILVISRDITAHRQAREKLDESEATFRGLVEHSLVGVYILQDGTFRYANPRFCEMLGYDAEELIDKLHVTDLVVEADRARVEDNIRRRIEGETQSIWYSLQGRRKDGSLIDVEVSGAVTSFRGKRAIIGTMLDVTERKRSEALQLALYRITEKASSLTDLAEFYKALHDILGELMYARNFYIALFDEQTKDLSFPYFVDEEDPPPPPQKLGRGLTEYVLRTGQPLLATPESFQQLVDRGEVVLQGGASVDWLGVPLLRGSTAFGVIVVQSYLESIRFGPHEQEILTYISRHIAVAIDRKRTEAALRESEERHRAIIAGMPDGIILHDARNSVMSFNPSALHILDLSPAEMAGWPETRRVTDPIHEDGTPFGLDEHPAYVTLRTGNPCTDVVMGFKTTAGARRWISINSQPMHRIGDELPYAVVVGITDITRRKEAENALARSELRFRSLVEAIPDWIWETDTEGRYTYASPRLKELLGYEPAEVLGKRPRDFMHPADAQRYSMQMAGTVNRVEAFSGLLNRHVRKDGRVVILETSAEPIIDDRGNFRGYRGIDRDITTRKEGEEELARLKMAVEQAAESILITEPDGTIVYVNPAFEQVSGYTRAEAIGNNPRLLKSGKHNGGFYAAMWQGLQRGEVWSGHITNRRKDGSLVEEQMVISPVRDAGGRIVNFVAVKRDMTHEVEIERRLRQSQKMESLGQLAGGIAHDFNNVLGVIQGGLSLLKTRITDESLSRYIEIGESAVNRGADVAKRLLTFSREGQIALRPLALADVVGDLTKVLEHSIERTIDIVTEIPRSLPIIQGDAGQLYQMLLNLCLNARDAILEEQPGSGTGRITISARTLPGEQVRSIFKTAVAPLYVSISLSDTGIGMTEEIRSRVFEPFFTTKPTGKGTGLGLSVVYGIVQSHNGMIDVESVPHGGTTFRIYLQAYPEETPAHKEYATPTVVGGQETILVVEDEEALRGLVAELLHSYGYTVLQAQDGMEGLAMFDEHRGKIDTIITDMGLPRMSGADMFAKIRAIDPEARVILASGYLEPGLKSRLFNAGAKAFIQKPYQPHEILRIVREVLDFQEQ
jgi:PAS domain S-box-containing protein